MSIHESMQQWGDSRPRIGNTFEDRVGVAPADPGADGVSEVLEVLSDGEAHTFGTIDAYLQNEGIELSGCQIGACLVRLHLDGHRIAMLPPYDSFGCPKRFKLLGSGGPQEDTREALKKLRSIGGWIEGRPPTFREQMIERYGSWEAYLKGCEGEAE